MYRIRFHGRGGQGMKTASRILGTAFFLEGFEVQDAPRYGAERRGAPIFAYVRADHAPIFERGVIRCPDLVLVADETLMPIPAAGVLEGLDDHTVLVITGITTAEDWRKNLNLAGHLIVVPLPADEDIAERRHVGVRLATIAARLTGVVSLSAIEKAIAEELSVLGPKVIEDNLIHARAAWELAAGDEGVAAAGTAAGAIDYVPPDWIVLGADDTALSAPIVHGEATSLEIRTGLWRVFRPVIALDHCTKCGICRAYCPDGAIIADNDGWPVVDYDHCKGCMVCVVQCPTHTIAAITEATARAAEQKTDPGCPTGSKEVPS
ncbi:MAG: pyruvate ferredoxin oxidoreductase gamma subunit [Alphaproteobacteria bacterium]|jgi:pyruvate ferredoxin oxidoreductase gamma subunit